MNLPQRLVEFTRDLLRCRVGDGGQRPQHVVALFPRATGGNGVTCQMTKPPGHAVAHHSIPDGFRHNQAKSWPTQAFYIRRAIDGVHHKEATPRAHPVFYRSSEVVASGELIWPR